VKTHREVRRRAGSFPDRTDRGAKGLEKRPVRGLLGILQERSALEVQVRVPRRSPEVRRAAKVQRHAVNNPDQDKRFDPATAAGRWPPVPVAGRAASAWSYQAEGCALKVGLQQYPAPTAPHAPHSTRSLAAQECSSHLRPIGERLLVLGIGHRRPVAARINLDALPFLKGDLPIWQGMAKGRNHPSTSPPRKYSQLALPCGADRCTLIAMTHSINAQNKQ
jgi:hypothetical protein